MKIWRDIGAWIAASILLLWRLTCRFRIVNDPRPHLRSQRRPYIYALLHAHQIAAVMINDEKRLAAMVSRSRDGDLLVPFLRLRRVVSVRGSTRKRNNDKGGREALRQLQVYLGQQIPALLAVDGPRGPRNIVHRGVAMLSRASGATIVPVIVVAKRRWVLERTWDRLQIPQPFTHITMVFGQTIDAASAADDDALRTQVRGSLSELEARYDPQEAHHVDATRPLPLCES